MTPPFRVAVCGALFAAVLLPLPLFAASGGAIGSICTTRPWANSIVSFILPDGLFDGLCSLWGFGNFVSPPQTQNTTGASETFNTAALTRGISCPAYAAPDEPTTISWSCGRGATLEAVAGFTLANRSITRTTVTPREASEVYGIRCSDGFESTCLVRTLNPRVDIWADPDSVRLGSRTNIFWQGHDVRNCRVIGPSFEEVGVSGGASTVPIITVSVFTAQCSTEYGDIVESSIVVDFAQ